MTRISTLAHHNLTQSQIFATQKRMQELQVQLSSGQKAMRYSGIARDTSQLVNLENTRMRTDQYLTGNNAVDLRLQAMEQSVAKNVRYSASALRLASICDSRPCSTADSVTCSPILSAGLKAAAALCAR